MADKERDSRLREMARHRGFRLVKSRRRKSGGDFGLYGLKTAEKGEECLGFGASGLTASADEIETFLRQQTATTWKKSLRATPKGPKKTEARTSRDRKSAPSLSPVERRTQTRTAPLPHAPPEEPKLRIRDADSADAEALAELVSAFAPATAEEIGDRLPLLRRAGEAPIVARLGDEVVGLVTWHVMAVLHRPKPVGRITYLEVAENHRRQGIGRELVAAAIARLEEKGCGAVEVTSHVKRTKAHGFYKALGFERTSYRFAKALAGKSGESA